MSKIIEAKDPYSAGYQQRICQLVIALARELGLVQGRIEGIRIASLVHGIAKISLPTEILSKPSILVDIKFNFIKNHSKTGYGILKSIITIYLRKNTLRLIARLFSNKKFY